MLRNLAICADMPWVGRSIMTLHEQIGSRFKAQLTPVLLRSSCSLVVRRARMWRLSVIEEARRFRLCGNALVFRA